MDKKYILFDLDGTLTDSAEGIINCVKYALTPHKIELPYEILRKFIGPPLKDAFQEYAGLSQELAEQAVEKYRERYRDIGIFECSLYENIEKMLRDLMENGKIIILATAKPKPFATIILKHFGLSKYFSLIVGAEFDGSLNYKKDIIAEVLKLAKIKDTGSAIMIGDRRHDIEGAKICGLQSVGVLYGFAENDELQKAGADYIASSPQEVADLILNR